MKNTTVETQTSEQSTRSSSATKSNQDDNFYDEISISVTKKKTDKKLSLNLESDYQDPIDFEVSKINEIYSQVNKKIAAVENLYDDVECVYQNDE